MATLANDLGVISVSVVSSDAVLSRGLRENPVVIFFFSFAVALDLVFIGCILDVILACPKLLV